MSSLIPFSPSSKHSRRNKIVKAALTLSALSVTAYATYKLYKSTLKEDDLTTESSPVSTSSNRSLPSTTPPPGLPQRTLSRSALLGYQSMSTLCYTRLFTPSILTPLITPISNRDMLKDAVARIKRGEGREEWGNLLRIVVQRVVMEIVARVRLIAMSDVMVVGLRVTGKETDMDRGVRWLSDWNVVRWDEGTAAVKGMLEGVEVKEREDGRVDEWEGGDVIGIVRRAVEEVMWRRDEGGRDWIDKAASSMEARGVEPFVADVIEHGYFRSSVESGVDAVIEEYRGIVSREMNSCTSSGDHGVGKEPVGKVMGKMEKWRRGLKGEEERERGREERIEWVWREFVRYKESKEGL